MLDKKKLSDEHFKQLIHDITDEQFEQFIEKITYDSTLSLIRDLREKLALIFSILRCSSENFLSQQEEDEIRVLLKRVNDFLTNVYKKEGEKKSEADPV